VPSRCATWSTLGQGAALQTGITYALRAGAKYLVTFDADGQHQVEDLGRLLGPVVRGEADIALGSRFLGAAIDMPATKRLVLRAAVAFTRVAGGIELTDTHNGLRALTAHAARKLPITQNRMAHASELLHNIVECELRYVEVPVTIRYTEWSRAKGQSHLQRGEHSLRPRGAAAAVALSLRGSAAASKPASTRRLRCGLFVARVSTR
jgi:glycosyltransferase involved in cell wall biosynthesis